MKRAIQTLTVAALMCGALVAGAQAATPMDGNDGGQAVTLVTGDRVLLGSFDGTQVMPVAGEGRAGMRFSAWRGGHTPTISRSRAH